MASDFNRDGKPDLATANSIDNDVTILLGSGAGGFTSEGNIGVDVAPYSVAAGDFNFDGKPDLATANYNGYSVSVLLGNGAGGFDVEDFDADGAPGSVAVGDFNRDGKPDLATANIRGNSVTILLGNGAGGFTSAGDIGVGAESEPVSIAVGDFNMTASPTSPPRTWERRVTILLTLQGRSLRQHSFKAAPAARRRGVLPGSGGGGFQRDGNRTSTPRTVRRQLRSCWAPRGGFPRRQLGVGSKSCSVAVGDFTATAGRTATTSPTNNT